MQQLHTLRTRALADARPTGPQRAMQDDADRSELQRLHAGMCPADRRRSVGSRAGRFNEISRGRWNPIWDLVQDARACAEAGQSEAAILAPFEAALAHARAAVRSVQPLPPLVALDIQETREQGEADVAVRMLFATPPDAPEWIEMADTAIRETREHRIALGRVEDGLRQEKVRVLHLRPRLALVR